MVFAITEEDIILKLELDLHETSGRYSVVDIIVFFLYKK